MSAPAPEAAAQLTAHSGHEPAMAMTEPRYQVRLENVFEGPMDLLVHLIRKNEVDIYDIPIAAITAQFLEYLEWMKAMNIDVAGDFIVMAATLTHIKSRLLLPVYEGDEEAADPRLEIARPLLEYLQMKAAAEELASRNLLGESTFVRPVSREALPPAPEEQIVQVGLFELIDAFKRILDNLSAEHRVELQTDRISVRERINQLVDLFELKGTLTFTELFAADATRHDIIVTFLAVLEMVKLHLLRLTQHVPSGVIRLFYQ
jgi:segregation and condensation protein A